MCFVNPHVLCEARRAFYHVPGRVLVRLPHRAGPLLPGRVQLGHVRYHGHDMGTQPYLTDEQVARIRGEEPAFDAECQAADAKAKADAEHAARIARTAEIAQWSSTKQVLHLLKNVIVAFWLALLWVFLWVLTQPGRSYRRRYYRRYW